MPPVTKTLLIANVAVYVLQSMGRGEIVAWFALWPPSSGPSIGPGFELWQLVTYSFLHGNLAHILFNMFALYTFGGDIERLFGPRFYLAYYLASVTSAALTHLLVNGLMGAPPYPMVGASGGVYGLLLAFGMYFPRRTIVLIFPPIPMPARVFVTVFAALELYFGVTGTAAGVAHFAHLGGMLGGWLMIQHRRKRFPFASRR
jgi:membrane associated rhomboid family serine protease